MKLRLTADGRTDSGGTALVCHNERLADPLDEFTRALGAITKKRNKTEEDHLEIGRLEFLGGLYTNPPMKLAVNGAKPVVGIPGWNILRCLQDGAKRQRRGSDVPRGVALPPENFAVLEFEGTADPHDLWRAGDFALRKTVGIQRSRTVRTRPIFTDWSFGLTVEVDPTVFDEHTLAVAWADAGRYCGLGEMRPVFGKFKGTVEVV